MNYVATVSCDFGKTLHGLSDLKEDEPHLVYKFKTPTSLMISEQDGGFYLFYLNESNQIISDTWHDSLAAAMAQAEFEFWTSKNDWSIAD